MPDFRGSDPIRQAPHARFLASRPLARSCHRGDSGNPEPAGHGDGRRCHAVRRQRRRCLGRRGGRAGGGGADPDGGGCFALLAPKGSDRLIALNGSGRAPRGATAEWYRERGFADRPPDSPMR
jgi:hypothetical protein